MEHIPVRKRLAKQTNRFFAAYASVLREGIIDDNVDYFLRGSGCVARDVYFAVWHISWVFLSLSDI